MISNEKGNAPAGAGTPTRAMGNGLATTFPYPDLTQRHGKSYSFLICSILEARTA